MVPDLNYAVYVWSSYAVFGLVCAWQWLVPILRRRRLLGQLAEQIEEELAEANLNEERA